MGIMRRLIIGFMLAGGGVLEARPISYPGGSTVMLKQDSRVSSQYYHYSPSYKFSVGLENVNDQGIGEQFSQIRATYLVHRKNTANSQRNFYVAVGLSPESSNHYFYGVHGDWESRRWYSGFSVQSKTVAGQSRNEQFIQLGVAPYLGNYGDFHTWLMVKVKHTELLGSWDVYPMLKFYQGDVLMEIGYSRDNEWDVHLMYRF